MCKAFLFLEKYLKSVNKCAENIESYINPLVHIGLVIRNMEKVNLDPIGLIRKLMDSNTSTEEEGQQFELILKALGFNKAKVTCGVVYLEGKGTLTCPPTSINSTAGMIMAEIDKIAGEHL